VARAREKIHPTIKVLESNRTGSDGRTINTANIGRKPVEIRAEARKGNPIMTKASNPNKHGGTLPITGHTAGCARRWRDRLAWLLLISVYLVPFAAKGELSEMRSVFVECAECGPVVLAKDVLIRYLPVNIQTPLPPKVIVNFSLVWRLLETGASRYGDISGCDDILLCSDIVKRLHRLVFDPEMQISARTLMNGRCFPMVADSVVHIHHRSSRGFGQYEICGGYPWSLIDQKVAPQITPLKVSYKSVAYASDKGNEFNAGLPPVKGFAPFGVGCLCLYFGWIPLREGRGSQVNFLLFLLGIALIGYGFFILLPWSVRVF
jgi:hypothetical protein